MQILRPSYKDKMKNVIAMEIFIMNLHITLQWNNELSEIFDSQINNKI